ncbi:hypothetical protein Sfum_0176 [Syntrophobacter fumaroxidans MPOB]|uniref:Uncharacterized protein n=1 Tax=Syntrophobacter fumaroxidans (strain DSM 10017 / MPOB) TaxID=335543 RepID=A0LEM6_SYNFM|nr:hypothetical protein Sfum_0176 [Syntrophobacter fumaroxidans MPOB]
MRIAAPGESCLSAASPYNSSRRSSMMTRWAVEDSAGAPHSSGRRRAWCRRMNTRRHRHHVDCLMALVSPDVALRNGNIRFPGHSGKQAGNKRSRRSGGPSRGEVFSREDGDPARLSRHSRLALSRPLHLPYKTA